MSLVPGNMLIIIIITFIAICLLMMIFHGCRKLCQDPGDPLPYGDGPSPTAPSPLPPLPALPSLPSGAIPVGLEPPPYSEVAAKPFLYPPPQGPCPECGRGAQPPLANQTNF
ncbi:transmembrane protein 92 [Melanerpes formicivorus]|uniref:transmembrane protein 92 n=1 Tax=Melanerpes formicivorus TaxID=211600 RepID=UPI003590296B